MQAHDGTLTLTSLDDGGLCVRVVLPKAAVVTGPSTRASPSTR